MDDDTRWLRWQRGAFTEEQCQEIEERVAAKARERDTERGPYVAHSGAVHHFGEESRH